MVEPTGVAVDYALNPRQFGKPDRRFQLVQDKLSRMLSDIVGMQPCCLRLAQLQDQGKVTRAAPV